MRKLLSMILTVCTLFAFSIPAYAQEAASDEVVSHEEIEAAYRAIGDEYGVELEVVEYDPDIIITRDKFEKALEYVRQVAQSEIVVQGLEADAIEETNIDPIAMVISRTRNGSFYLSQFPSSATIRVAITVSMDADRGTIISVDKIDSYQSGFATDFENWIPVQHTPYTNSPSNGWVTVDVVGRVVWVITEPTSGTKFTDTVDVNQTVQVNFN